MVLATHNEGKRVELEAILGAVYGDVTVQTAGELGLPDVKETGVTFEQNALLKARAAALATGLPAFADDSGLAVDVMGGAPGFLSARWSGSHGNDLANLTLLLAQLSDIPDEHRSAAFVCAAAFVSPDGVEVVREGRMPGALAREPRGENGFGYDPIFVPDGGGVSAAEMMPEEKNAVSHRRRAFDALAIALAEL